MARHIKKGDMVEVIAGDSRGVRGKVLSVDPGRGRIVVEGINRVHKHVKPSQRYPQGGRVQVEQPIHISNVLPVSPKADQGMRVHFEIDDKGEKTRVAADGGRLDVIKRSKK